MPYSVTQSEQNTGGDVPDSMYEWFSVPKVYVIKEKSNFADIAYENLVNLLMTVTQVISLMRMVMSQ